jgi:hypothetical protein
MSKPKQAGVSVIRAEQTLQLELWLFKPELVVSQLEPVRLYLIRNLNNSSERA